MKQAEATKNNKKLIRLISALVDMRSAAEAYDKILKIQDKEITALLVTHFVVAYWRPFTQNYGAGRILDDYPNYPANEPEHIKKAHKILDQMRNKFCAHSSAEGYKIFITPKGTPNPVTGSISEKPDWTLQRRTFQELDHLKELRPALQHFAEVLIKDIRDLLKDTYDNDQFKSPIELPTRFDEFQTQ